MTAHCPRCGRMALADYGMLYCLLCGEVRQPKPPLTTRVLQAEMAAERRDYSKPLGVGEL